MRDLLLLVIVLVLVFMTFKKPFYGVLAWCWLSYMLPHKLAWGFMVSFPVAQVIAIAFLISLLYSKESKKIQWCSPIVWLLIFNVWMLFTVAVGSKEFGALGFYNQAVKVQFFTFMIYIMLTSRKRIEQALAVICCSIGYYGVKGGVFSVLTGGAYRVWGPTSGFFEGNNELALTLLMALPIMYYFMRTVTNRWLKWSIAAAMLLCIAAVLGTQSRGALVAILAVGGFFWLKSDKKFIAALLIIIMLPVAYSAMPESWHARMSTIIEADEESYDGSIQGRFNAWRMSYYLASDNLLGGGFGAFNRVNFILYAPNPDDFHDAHSIYFKVLGQQGFIGLFIFLSLWISAWRLANRVQKLVKNRQDMLWANLLCRMLQVSFVAYASGGMFLGLTYFDLPYHMLITVCAVYVIVKRDINEKSRETANLAIRPALQ